jgi:hypothetical protein
MIKRLIEEDGLDSVDRQLADLFRAAEPFAPDVFGSRRVWVRLERTSRNNASLRPRLKAAVVVTLLFSGTAVAALGQRYISMGRGVPMTASARPIVDATVTRSRAIRKPALDRSSVSGKESAPAAVDSSVQPFPPFNGARRAVRGQARAETSEDATKVVEAIQALRTERDPARARALLSDYLKARPRGALSGEALALSIEAASAQRDPRAAEYARRYLSSYPKGKYRELAKRAIEAQH